jgi:hypothetical protein
MVCFEGKGIFAKRFAKTIENFETHDCCVISKQRTFPTGETLWLSVIVMRKYVYENQKIPGSLPSPAGPGNF